MMRLRLVSFQKNRHALRKRLGGNAFRFVREQRSVHMCSAMVGSVVGSIIETGPAADWLNVFCLYVAALHEVLEASCVNGWVCAFNLSSIARSTLFGVLRDRCVLVCLSCFVGSVSCLVNSLRL